MGGRPQWIKDCPSNGKRTPEGEPTAHCPLWEVRMGTRTPGISLLEVVRRKCWDCLGSSQEIKKCTVPGCALYKYRLGEYPEEDR